MKLRAVVYTTILVTVWFGCERSHQRPAATDSANPNPPNHVLPRLDLAGLRDLIATSDREDRVLVVDFWATWCKPCVEIFPRVHKGLKSLGDRARVVSVTLDAPGDLELRAVEFLERHDAMSGAYLLVPDSDERLEIVSTLGRRWQDLVVPAILVYNIDGHLEVEFLGGEVANVDLMVFKIGQLLGSSAWVATPNAVTQP